MKEELSMTANLVGDAGRAAILLSLMGGVALPAGELATIANVAPQTASGHLAKLIDGGLLSVERQGRHRYYRLSSAEVADAIEALLVLTGTTSNQKSTAKSRATPGSLAYARTCYSHLAGWLGVQIAEQLKERAFLQVENQRTYTITSSGRIWFQSLGIKPPQVVGDPARTARRCLDWTERRHHLAGTVGCSLFSRMLELKWISEIRGTRAIRVSLEGKRSLWNLLRIPLG